MVWEEEKTKFVQFGDGGRIGTAGKGNERRRTKHTWRPRDPLFKAGLRNIRIRIRINLNKEWGRESLNSRCYQTVYNTPKSSQRGRDTRHRKVVLYLVRMVEIMS